MLWFLLVLLALAHLGVVLALTAEVIWVELRAVAQGQTLRLARVMLAADPVDETVVLQVAAAAHETGTQLEVPAAATGPVLAFAERVLASARQRRAESVALAGVVTMLRPGPRELGIATAALMHNDPTVAQAACRLVAEAPDRWQELAVPLASFVRDGLPAAALAGEHALGRLLENDLDLSLLMAEDPDPRVRWLAVLAMGGPAGSDPRVVAAVRAGAEDESPLVRAAVCRVLAGIPQPLAVDLLVSALRDPQPVVRLEAARALGRCPAAGVLPAAVDQLPELDAPTAFVLLEALRGSERLVTGELLGDAFATDERRRVAVLRILAVLGGVTEALAVVPLLDDDCEDVRREVPRVLTAIARAPNSPLAASAPLMRQLRERFGRENDPELLLALGETLASSGDPEVIGDLLSRLPDSEALVRERLLELIAIAERDSAAQSGFALRSGVSWVGGSGSAGGGP